MLLSIVPQLSRVAILADLANPTHPRILTNLRAAADKSRVTILPLDAQTTQEIESAFAAMTRQNAGAVIVLQGPLFTQQHRQIAELAAKNRLPSISVNSEFAESGCLISYGPNRAYYYLRAAIFVDKIIKGAKPAELPVEQPTKFELIINGKTAKALGLAIPQSLLISADKVIE
jgi:putative ABC transport system substrate-binding protein